MSTGGYAIGFLAKQQKYFHVRLGPRSIIVGYENLYEKRAEFTYKAIQHVDAYGLRKKDIKPILDEEPDLKKQMYRYTLDYYHEIVRKPMLEFKRTIYSQIFKRQDQAKIMKQLDAEIQA